jgi:hypothetical protein
MHLDPAASIAPRWPAASRRRLMLAAYLDYLLLGAPWTIGVWALEAFWPALGRLSLPLRIGYFLVLEAILLGPVKWSPGQYCMGIVAWKRSAFADPRDPDTVKPSYLVDPWLKANGRWWTVLFGVLVIEDAARSISRWTMWHAPMPVMGMQLSSEATIAFQILFGLVEVAVGVAVLRLKPVAMPLGLAVYGFMIASTVLSWELLPAWLEQAVTAKRAFLGRPTRPGEIGFMSEFVPVGTVIAGVVALGWLGLIWRRARRAAAG